ncbi:4-nitrophenylphosphatase [Penicillium diatomitis]|uniref:4-nitrophenylphosphatase n=1 Tax=Penicillium diatomitis TaxID=2819901 RepID=A0A9W9XI69_9EURO|nr:4-nitrophenylphosphatase [Penicillium diatomitis]KAJ5493458.1 4-nitrophenylphosphatase [Penicillium diatomitis]
MTEAHPASTTTPRYLTGDKAGLREFLDKFDVGSPSPQKKAIFARGLFINQFSPTGLSLRLRRSHFSPGVLWSGDHVFPGTVDTLELLRKNGKQVVFVTNNSTKSRADYLKKLESLGIPSNVEEIFSSSYSSAIYISRILQLPENQRKVYVIGESGIEQELRSESVPFIGGTDPAYRRDIQPEDYKHIAAGDPSILDPEVGVVLVGLDFHLNYFKLALAYHYVKRGAVFLATNVDSTLPNSGTLFPGAGSMSAPLIMMLGRDPVALGKPSQAMMDAIEGKFHFDRSRACMVGDRVNTDIRFGIEGQLGGTLGVLTGVSSKEEFVSGSVQPLAYLDKLSDLLDAEQ